MIHFPAVVLYQLADVHRRAMPRAARWDAHRRRPFERRAVDVERWPVDGLVAMCGTSRSCAHHRARDSLMAYEDLSGAELAAGTSRRRVSHPLPAARTDELSMHGGLAGDIENRCERLITPAGRVSGRIGSAICRGAGITLPRAR